ncbi:hypothetical protein EV360DRAFT_52978 [Lentinula raphanica]|nr:hypothetical protein EV360DRAFT_52978 [Lentinula raphanica]
MRPETDNAASSTTSRISILSQDTTVLTAPCNAELPLSGTDSAPACTEEIYRKLALRVEHHTCWEKELEDPDIDLKKPSSSLIVTYLTSSFPKRRAQHALSDFKAWCNRRYRYTYPRTFSAIARAACTRNERNILKRKFVSALLLNPSSVSTQSAIRRLWENIPVHQISRLDAPYPPVGHWMVDHEPIWSIWHHHLQHGKQPDRRIPRKPMMRVDLALLQWDLQETSSAIFEDIVDGKPLMIVVRDICAVREVVHWVNDIVLKNVASQRNVRVQDAGCIVISGWSAGSRSKPAFDFVRNFLSAKTEEEKHSLRYEAASAFAFFWNMICALGPKEVLDDIDAFLSDSKIYSMDANCHAGGVEKTYTITVDDVPITFREARMAPPSGVFARNYARPVHNEKQPHEWSIAWTTYRASHGKELGGHFYNCDYGIRVRSATNTCVFWKPLHYHGTSLQNVSPSEKGGPLIQSGLSIVTSPRLVSVFHQFVSGTISERDLTSDCYTGEDDILSDQFGTSLSLQ